MTPVSWRTIRPIDVLKWGAVVFVYCVGILFLISVVLAMFGVYG